MEDLVVDLISATLKVHATVFFFSSKFFTVSSTLCRRIRNILTPVLIENRTDLTRQVGRILNGFAINAHANLLAK
jgi:hypothetical protein